MHGVCWRLHGVRLRLHGGGMAGALQQTPWQTPTVWPDGKCLLLPWQVPKRLPKRLHTPAHKRLPKRLRELRGGQRSPIRRCFCQHPWACHAAIAALCCLGGQCYKGLWQRTHAAALPAIALNLFAPTTPGALARRPIRTLYLPFAGLGPPRTWGWGVR